MMAPLQRRRRNATVVASLLLIVTGMVVLVYYSAPLYRLFSDVTGFGGTTRVAQAVPTGVIDREITVRFDANIASGLPWRFVAPEPVRLRLGEERVVSYKGKNIGDEPGSDEHTSELQSIMRISYAVFCLKKKKYTN